MVRWHRLFSLGVGVCALAAPAAAQERLDPPVHPYAFSPIDFPGATLTSAWGINATGEVVGNYQLPDGSIHGFLLRGGQFTAIDFPGAVMTQARGIGPEGEIVGNYRRPGEPALNSHGFLRTREGTFVGIDVPNHVSTIPQRIGADGTIVGCYHDGDTMQSMRGFALDGRGWRELQVGASMHNGVTPDGRTIVGLYTDMDNRVRAYVVDEGKLVHNFAAFDVPGSTFTQAWDINTRGETAGVFRDAAGAFHGFVRADGDFTSVDVPGATATRALGINAEGDVVGNYVDGAGRTHGFLAGRSAGHIATLVLRSGERLTGQLLDMSASGFTVATRGEQRRVGTHEVAVIGFVAGGLELPGVEVASVPEGRHLVVRRDGERVSGLVFDVGGTRPLTIAVDTDAGLRVWSSNEIARIYLARPPGS